MEVKDDVLLIDRDQKVNNINKSEFSSSIVKHPLSNRKKRKKKSDNWTMDKKVNISLRQLKAKYVMSKKFRMMHKLEHSNIALICRQLINLERKCKQITGKQKQTKTDDQFYSQTNLTMADGIKASTTSRRFNENLTGESKSVLKVDFNSDRNEASQALPDCKELSSISIQTPSGLQCIATRAVKISRRLSVSRPSLKWQADETEPEVKSVKTKLKSGDNRCPESPKEQLLVDYQINTPQKTYEYNGDCTNIQPEVVPNKEEEKSIPELPLHFSNIGDKKYPNAKELSKSINADKSLLNAEMLNLKRKNNSVKECVNLSPSDMNSSTTFTSAPTSSNGNSLTSTPVNLTVDNDCVIINPVETVCGTNTPKKIKLADAVPNINNKKYIEKVNSTFAVNRLSDKINEVEIVDDINNFQSVKDKSEVIMEKVSLEDIVSESSSPYAMDNTRMSSIPNVIQEPQQFKDNDECLIIEKVESISPESAAALISEADLRWDSDILPSNFLQCDMQVNDTEAGMDIYKDAKLIGLPTVLIKKLTSSDLNERFITQNKLNRFTQVYCKSILKKAESKGKIKKKSYIPNILQKDVKSLNSSTPKELGNIIPSKQVIPNSIDKTESNLEKCVADEINPFFINVDTQVENSEQSNFPEKYMVDPLNYHQLKKNTSKKSIPEKCVSKAQNSISSKPSYIRTKPLSFLMEQNVNEYYQRQLEKSKKSVIPDQNHNNHSNKSFQNPPLPESQVVNSLGSPLVPLALAPMSAATAIPDQSAPKITPVSTYSLTHSIFGSLVDNDKGADPNQRKEVMLSTVPYHGQSFPPLSYKLNSNIVTNQISGAPQILPNQFQQQSPMPLFTRPMIPVNSNYQQNINNQIFPQMTMSNSPIILPPNYNDVPPLATPTVDFERPLLLLQQPFIPVQGGGILQKERAEEECNSVKIDCNTRHTISHELIERVSTLLKNMKEVGYPDSTYSLQHTAYQLLVSNGACCLIEAMAVVNSRRFRMMMFIPESAPKYVRPTIPTVEKVVLKFFPGYKMFVLKRFTFAVDFETRELIYPMPPFCLPKNNPIVDKITILLLICPSEGFGPGLVVLPHAILTNKLRNSLSNEPSLNDWGLSGHNSGGLTRTIVHDYLTGIALPWITSVKSQQWENYLLVDRWWTIDKLSIPSQFTGFHTFGLHQMYKANYDPLDVFFNMTLQRMWGVLCRKWSRMNGTLTEDMFPKFFIQSLTNLYSNANIADFCAQTGLYPIDMNRAYQFTQQNFAY